MFILKAGESVVLNLEFKNEQKQKQTDKEIIKALRYQSEERLKVIRHLIGEPVKVSQMCFRLDCRQCLNKCVEVGK